MMRTTLVGPPAPPAFARARLRARAFAPSAALLAAAFATPLAACSKGGAKEDRWIQDAALLARSALSPTPEPVTDALLSAAVDARGRLADFYLKMFPSLIQSGFYDTQPASLQANHFAHRLLVRDADPTRAEAARWLAGKVQIGDVLVRKGAISVPLRTAWFPDDIQLHRDEYAAIMSEMGVNKIGEATLQDLLQGARLDFGYWKQSKRADLPWTMTLMAKNGARNGSFRNAEGASFTLAKIAMGMAAGNIPEDARAEFSTYDFQMVYSMTAATAEGFSMFLPATKELLNQAFERAATLNAADRIRRATNQELVGRINVNGHLVEAFFRGRDEDFPLADHRLHLEPMIVNLLADARELAKSVRYEGTPEAFVAVPHAIHGLDMAIARLGGFGLGPTAPPREGRAAPAAPAASAN